MERIYLQVRRILETLGERLPNYIWNTWNFGGKDWESRKYHRSSSEKIYINRSIK